MHAERLIVLKFGGSVLQRESRLRLAVHEIYRWRRAGYQVIAVVSALAGRTDALLRKSRLLCPDASGATVAALVGTGELHSAALLGLQLDRAGIPACVLGPAAIGMVAQGDSLDAVPADLDETALRRALAAHGVVVVPGFVACDEQGRAVVLGRGGSDLTALFLAQRLRPQVCRLVKDVDGLYETDPARPGPAPRRFARATWTDALRTDGSIIQHKAVAFARAQGVVFELGRIGGVRPTQIGPGPTAYCEPERPVRLRVALLGLGTVGGGVYGLLQEMPELFEIVAVAVRDPQRARGVVPDARGLTGDVLAAVRCGADVVVELMGGVQPAGLAIEAALRAGSHVVTANKALLAQDGARLARLADACARDLHYSGAVGGSMPLLERLSDSARPAVCAVRGILNGTTNYVLDAVSRGVDFAAAVQTAQRLGLAERDPSRDLRGLDAADKLRVVARTITGLSLPETAVERDELSAASVEAALQTAGPGRVLRHVAALAFDQRPLAARVRLVALSAEDPLAAVPREWNAAQIAHVDGSAGFVRGRGAGRWPTAESVVADLWDVARRQVSATETTQRAPGGRTPAGVARAG